MLVVIVDRLLFVSCFLLVAISFFFAGRFIYGVYEGIKNRELKKTGDFCSAQLCRILSSLSIIGLVTMIISMFRDSAVVFSANLSIDQHIICWIIAVVIMGTFCGGCIWIALGRIIK